MADGSLFVFDLFSICVLVRIFFYIVVICNGYNVICLQKPHMEGSTTNNLIFGLGYSKAPSIYYYNKAAFIKLAV